MPAIAASPRRNDEADHRKVDRFQASRSRRRKLRDSARGNFEFVWRISTAWVKKFVMRLVHGHFPRQSFVPPSGLIIDWKSQIGGAVHSDPRRSGALRRSFLEGISWHVAGAN